MKRIIVALLCVLLCLSIAACDGEGAQDVIGKYANKIEDSKEELEKGFDRLQEAVEEVKRGAADK